MKRDINESDVHFDRCMDLWRRWMRGVEAPRGYSGLDSVCGRSKTNFMAGEDDSEIVYEKEERKTAEKVNACVESLMPAERGAVMKRYGFMRFWPFKNLPEETTLEMAMMSLRNLIAKRC